LYRVGTPDGVKDTTDPGEEKFLFCPGNTVRLTFKLVNAGPTVRVAVSCTLLDHAIPETSSACYDSHDPRRTPSGKIEDVVRLLQEGETAHVSFDYALPAWAACGPYGVTAEVSDTESGENPRVLAHFGRGLQFRVWAPSVSVPILVYHDVSVFPGPYRLTSTLLDQQLTALKAYGYEGVKLADFLSYRTGAPAPQKPVVLTFDDGKLNQQELAVPILERHGFTASFFIITSKATAGADAMGSYIQWPGIRAMRDAGFEIGSHSITHPLLTRVSPSEMLHEVTGSKRELERHLGEGSCATFAYPYGDVNAAVQAAVRDAGYHAALAVGWKLKIENTATCNLFALNRIGVSFQHGTILDPSRPGDFFMRLVDPKFPIPNLSVADAVVEDQAGHARTSFTPGETAVVKVKVRNSGSRVEAVASLQLRFGADAEAAPVYDSHVAGQDATGVTLGDEETVVQFTWAVPPDALPGPYFYKCDFLDRYRVLVWNAGRWSEGFLVVKG
jgi:peptidoglycan/xylan/chitin deacetylase (PgdA/CDA1 family)